MKRALITGILGQDGAYLAKLLLDKGYKVSGLMRRYSKPSLENLEYLDIADKIDYVVGDMTDHASLIHVIKNTRPDEVYNLAAQSFVGSSWDAPVFTTETNALGVIHLLNAVRMFAPTARFYQASTSEMFGNSTTESSQNEQTPFRPCSPYAISKLHAYWTTVNYRESYGLFACNGILFNHESPIRGIEFVTRKITHGVAMIKAGKATHITLGNLHAQRDWGFSGDYVEAMWLMLQHPTPEDFVIATGITHSITDFVKLAFHYAGIEEWEKYVKSDPQFVRPKELNALRGDASKALNVLGWKPKVAFEDLVKMMVEADLKRLA